jgi:predicted regulator of Ras-like GTPase activity (Roadblock/LC7/MglB family)
MQQCLSDRLDRPKAAQLAAIACGLASLTLGGARCIDGGLVKQTVVEIDKGLLVVMSISDGSCLTVLAGSACDVGVVAYEMTVLVDFDQERIGLHINGTARIVRAEDRNGGRPRAERWVEVRVQEAYIHCRKHLPHLVKADENGRPWGTDDARAKGGDYFGASCEPRPWVADS